MAKARILAVDDQRYFRELIEGLLTEEGYDVVTASSGEEALHILEREDFEVVLTDLVMPGIDGGQLVLRIKERLPDQDIVMVTGVVDVKTAVGAMKQGATDYILKPFDRNALAGSLEKILQRRRLREEHARLMEENLEYMGVLSLYERAAGLFSTVSLEPLAERLVEGLCLETGAQGGVVWVADGLDSTRLRLTGVRGLIRVEEEPREIAPERLGTRFGPLLDEGRSLVRERSALHRDAGSGNTAANSAANSDAAADALFVPLVHAGKLLGIARLSDKLEGDAFTEPDRAAAEKFVALGASAVANALRFRALERLSFRDPTTRAYTHAYFDDAVRNEIQKASRFGRSFSIIRIDCGGLAELRERASQNGVESWIGRLVRSLSDVLRATDLLATDGASRYSMLLPETDALGAAILRQRLETQISESGILNAFGSATQAELTLAVATYPSDGTQPEALERTLDGRIAEDRLSLFRTLGLAGRPYGEIIGALLEEGELASAKLPGQVARFLVDEAARRSRERGLLVLAPGPELGPLVDEAVLRLGEAECQTELVVLGQPDPGMPLPPGVTWVSPERAGRHEPFALYYGDGPVYTMVSGPCAKGQDRLPFFHSADRALVEHLAFQLKRDLGIPLGA